MKYLFITLVFASLQTQAQKPFTLSGEVKGTKDGILYLGYSGAEGKRVSDSTRLQDGHFQFSGNVMEPVMAYISLNNRRASMGDPNVFGFFLEPAAMNMTMTLNKFGDAVVTGSKVQDEYAVLQRQQEKFDKRWQIVFDTLSAINKRSNVLYQETKNWALSPYNEEAEEVRAEFIQQYPASYVTAWLLRFERGISTDSLKKLYNVFPAEVKESAYGKDVAKELERRKTGIPGVAATLFNSTGIDGKPVNLVDFRGKYVVLDFWASWCVPCRKGNPHMKELYARYKHKGFEVIGIASDDSNPALWKKAVEQDGLPWKQVLAGLKVTRKGDEVTYDDSRNISKGYNIHTLPTLFLIDPKGMIIGRYGDELGESHAALDKKLEEIFK